MVIYLIIFICISCCLGFLILRKKPDPTWKEIADLAEHKHVALNVDYQQDIHGHKHYICKNASNSVIIGSGDSLEEALCCALETLPDQEESTKQAPGKGSS